jgi:proline iminopeptidase
MRLHDRPGTNYWDLPTGSRIGYILLSAKEKKSPFPLIYLHGGPGAGITDLEVKILGKIADRGFDVYLYDQVGCGHSSRLKNINEYSAERHKKDLEAIVEKIGAQKVVLIGQSWGSILATLCLADNPSKVAKLVITAPAPIQPHNKKYDTFAPPRSLLFRRPMFTNAQASKAAANTRSKAIDFWLTRFHSKLASDEEADQFQTYLTNFLNKCMVCDSTRAVVAEGTEGYYVHYMARLSLGKVSDPRAALAKSNIPVLVMKAQCDNQKWGYTQEYIDLFRNHQFIIVRNAGHNIFIEQPEEYVDAIYSFISK